MIFFSSASNTNCTTMFFAELVHPLDWAALSWGCLQKWCSYQFTRHLRASRAIEFYSFLFGAHYTMLWNSATTDSGAISRQVTLTISTVSIIALDTRDPTKASNLNLLWSLGTLLSWQQRGEKKRTESQTLNLYHDFRTDDWSWWTTPGHCCFARQCDPKCKSWEIYRDALLVNTTHENLCNLCREMKRETRMFSATVLHKMPRSSTQQWCWWWWCLSPYGVPHQLQFSWDTPSDLFSIVMAISQEKENHHTNSNGPIH